LRNKKDFEAGLRVNQSLTFKAWNVCHRYIHAFNFKTSQTQKSLMFTWGSGRQNVGLGPTVGCLGLFIVPRSTF